MNFYCEWKIICEQRTTKLLVFYTAITVPDAFPLPSTLAAKKVLIEKLLILVRENGKVKLFPSPKQFIKIFSALLTCFSSIFPNPIFFFYYEAINQDINDSTGNYKNDSFLLATSDEIDRKSGEFTQLRVCITVK